MAKLTGAHQLRIVAHKLAAEAVTVKSNLAGRLRSLEHDIVRARKQLEDGDVLDTNLIVNASGIDALIARWNFTVDYAPYVVPDKDEKS